MVLTQGDELVSLFHAMPRSLGAAMLVCALLVGGAATGAVAPPKRIAILVGATKAPLGQVPLRYSYRDVAEMAAVLEAAGEFAPQDVHQLLDPEPASVLRTMDEALATLRGSAGETLLVFYYSGHADDQALYPDGEALSLASLKARLESSDATVRLGILDSCRGGAWTRAKGLEPDAPFQVVVPLTLTSEGSALIASSSGLESAHESEALQASFFTHHFVAGLRGAADRSGTGEVTLAEAFAYAQERTIRDSAEQTGVAQHPSFDIHLHGRQDLALTRIDRSPSVVGLTEIAGPLQIIQLQSGLVVLEVPSGKATLKLALPPGRYLVQRRDGDATFAREISVVEGETSDVNETSLVPVGKLQLLAKGPEEPPIENLTTLPRGDLELQLSLGVAYGTGPGFGFGSTQTGAGSLVLLWGVTDRLQIPLPSPAIAYRFGDAPGIEWVPWGGMTHWDLVWSNAGNEDGGSSGAFRYTLGAGLDTRFTVGRAESLILSLSTTSAITTVEAQGQTGICAAGCPISNPHRSPDTWAGVLKFGYSRTLADVVTFNLGISGGANYLYNGKPPGAGEGGGFLGVGSVLALGLRSLPLIEVHLSRRFSLDGYVSLIFDFHGNLVDNFLAGFSWVP